MSRRASHAPLLDGTASSAEQGAVYYDARPQLRTSLREWARPRAVGLLIALAIELLLLLAIISLGSGGSVDGDADGDALVSFNARDVVEPVSPEPEPEPEPAPEEAAQAEEQPAVTAPAPEQPAETPETPVVPVEAPRPPIAIVLPRATEVPLVIPPPAPAAPTPSQAPAAAPAAGPAQGASQGPIGPPNTGASNGVGADTPRVGTMPSGEPLYAAAWYREPLPGELTGYLSTASGPGWGLIACRTAPDWKVEDCVMLDEFPNGSNIARSALAAAWQFKVRPPRVGGKVLVGEWVRIRIDYGVRPRS